MSNHEHAEVDPLEPIINARTGEPYVCLGPQGSRMTCTEPATHYMKFGTDWCGGGWYLCAVCVVRVALWLDEEYEGQPGFSIELETAAETKDYGGSGGHVPLSKRLRV